MNRATASYADPDWQRLVSAAVKTRSLPFRNLDDLISRPDELRSLEDPVDSPLSPAGRVVRETKPQMSWPAREAATYVVLIYADDEEAARSESLSVSRWTPPKALQRGRTYTWQVTISIGGSKQIVPSPEQPPARFRITSAGEEREITAALKAHPDDFLLHAVLYAEAGLVDSAGEALRRAAATGNTDARAILGNADRLTATSK